MKPNLLDQLKNLVKGEVATDPQTLSEFSHDASLFEIMPQAVVFPKDQEDVVSLVKFVEENKKENPDLSLTGRSAGTDMSGGSVNDSILVSFTKYFNKTPVVHKDYVTTEPGVYYRDFEKETLKEHLIFPSYPASREICAMGGIVNNNSGGEKSLKYGKTEKYVKRVKVVLSDGSVVEFMPLTEKELMAKIKLKTLEGKIYKDMFQLVSKNYKEIQKHKPTVNKNSSGYNLWDVWDPDLKIFDLTKLWVGAQGTLGLLLEADIKLQPVAKHHEMMIVFLHDYKYLNEIIDKVLTQDPESFESYDDNTLKLALRFFPEFSKLLGTKGLLQTALDFLPEFLMVLFGGLPKLILQIDFAGDDPDELRGRIAYLKEVLRKIHPKVKVAVDKQEQKYWLIRRESFNLLRQKIHDLHTAPFIDDFVIDPHDTAEILPKISSIVKKHRGFIFTIAGHVGNGNFHIIPLTDIQKKSVREAIPIIADKVYKIVKEYHGSITGEHNDGLIRTPYIKEMFGEEMVKLFEKTKEIFDPQNIFNPRKKVNGSLSFALEHIRENF